MGRTNVPKGEARRDAIVRAALELIGEQGLDAVTHRALADRAGVPLSATTYWFASKDAILQQALLLAAREEVERLERVVLALAGKELDVTRWADVVAAEMEDDPTRHVAFTELILEGTRRPWLREEVARWEEAFLRLAELGLRATGSPDPVTDARLVVATITGLMIGQLTNPQPDFEDEVFRPALERLFTRLVERQAVTA